MARIPGRWRLVITLAALADAVLAILILHDTMTTGRSPEIDSVTLAFVMTPWCLLALLWLFGWTWQGFAKKKAGD